MSDSSSVRCLPLFDRLATHAPAADRMESIDVALRQSIQRELQRLLSCRSRLHLEAFLSDASDVLDYGIPDSTAMTMAAEADRDHLAKAIHRAITLFEPRLRDISVVITAAPTNGVDALVRIEGTLVSNPSSKRSTFTMTTIGNTRAVRGFDLGSDARFDLATPDGAPSPLWSVSNTEARDA